MAANRKPIVGGNWKMNTDAAAGASIAQGVAPQVKSLDGAVEVVVFPPFPYLTAVGKVISNTNIVLGAQDVYHEPDGAFTGEVSVNMLRDCGCTWVLAGHSERRHVIGESDQLINRKLQAALEGGLSVILCVGETQAQREADQTNEVNTSQVRAGLEGVAEADLSRIVIAYEPVWAIGTGLTASPADAQNAHAVIRREVSSLYNDTVAANLRIQYGGSVKPGNAAELFAQPDIDGGLIGGASLKPDDFAAIVLAAAATTSVAS